MAKVKKQDSKKTVKHSKKQALKMLLAQKLNSALEDIKDHWTPQKFESRLKKAIKLFSDGKAPQKKKTKKSQEPANEGNALPGAGS